MKRILVLFILVLIFTGCNKDNEIIIAKVNDKVLTANDLELNFGVKDWKILSHQEIQNYIDQWIQITLLAQEADKLHLTEKLSSKIENAVNKIKANALIAQKLASFQISEEELFSYYKLHKSKFKTKEKEYKVQRIFVKSETKLQDVLSSLSDGMKFTEAAKLFSEEIAGENGGYVGFINKKSAEKEVWKTLQKLSKFRYKSVEIPDGFYVIRYYDSKLVETEKTFVQVKDEIESIVRKNKKEEMYNQIIEDLKMDANIIISN